MQQCENILSRKTAHFRLSSMAQKRCDTTLVSEFKANLPSLRVCTFMREYKISHLPSKLRFSAKCSFFGQSLSREHYQPIYQPPEVVYLLNSLRQDSCSRNCTRDPLSNLNQYTWSEWRATFEPDEI